MLLTCQFHSRSSFFGHPSKENQLEIIFSLVYHGKLTRHDIYYMPIPERTWFFERLVKQLEEEAKVSKGVK